MPDKVIVEVNLLVLVKTMNEGEAKFGLKLVDPSGAEHKLGGLPETVKVKSKFPDSTIPTGTTLGLHLNIENIEPKPLGTYYLKVELDGAEVAVATFTLIRPPSTDKQS